MDLDRAVVAGTLGLIVIVALATGPVFSLASIPQGGVTDGPALGTGTADLSVVSAPQRANLTADEYAAVYHLSVPRLSLNVSSVTGAPLLTLSLDIDRLGYSRKSVYVLASSEDRTRHFSIESASVSSDRIDRDDYHGQLRLIVRSSTGKRVIYDEPISISVQS